MAGQRPIMIAVQLISNQWLHGFFVTFSVSAELKVHQVVNYNQFNKLNVFNR